MAVLGLPQLRFLQEHLVQTKVRFSREASQVLQAALYRSNPDKSIPQHPCRTPDRRRQDSDQWLQRHSCIKVQLSKERSNLRQSKVSHKRQRLKPVSSMGGSRRRHQIPPLLRSTGPRAPHSQRKARDRWLQRRSCTKARPSRARSHWRPGKVSRRVQRVSPIHSSRGSSRVRSRTVQPQRHSMDLRSRDPQGKRKALRQPGSSKAQPSRTRSHPGISRPSFAVPRAASAGCPASEERSQPRSRRPPLQVNPRSLQETVHDASVESLLVKIVLRPCFV